METEDVRARRIVQELVDQHKDSLPRLDHVLAFLTDSVRRLWIQRILSEDTQQNYTGKELR